MTVDWHDYEIFDPGTWGPLGELPRREARAAYQRLMDARGARFEELAKLVAKSGIKLEWTYDSLQAVNDWFRTNVTADPRDRSRLLPEWYSVTNDIGLFLGDFLIRQHPGLHWEFDTSHKGVTTYQRHVIMGFKNFPDPDYALDLDMAVARYGHAVLLRQDIDVNAFVDWVRTAEQRA